MDELMIDLQKATAMEMANWRLHLWQMSIPEALSSQRYVQLSAFPTDMNYSRFLTTVSAARKESPIRLLSEYIPSL